MRKLSLTLAAVVGSAFVAVSLSAPAMARIKCNGQYQIVAGSHLATPYCGDNYLAKVARSYGIKVSNRTIRQNPNKKREVCDFIGRDNRVAEICAPNAFVGRSVR